MKSWTLLAFVLSIVLAATTASSSSPGLSKEVMKNLDNLYKYSTDNNWQLQKYPKPDLIILLNSNEGYRGALESTVYDWEKFYTQVFHIIEKETALGIWDVFGYALKFKTAVDIGCLFVDCGPAKEYLKLMVGYSSSSSK